MTNPTETGARDVAARIAELKLERQELAQTVAELSDNVTSMARVVDMYREDLGKARDEIVELRRMNATQADTIAKLLAKYESGAIYDPE